MTHALALWAHDREVARLSHDPLNNRWSLDYHTDWVRAPDAFPLSPALPFAASEGGHGSGAIERFVENLLPEGRSLEIAALTHRVSKSNLFGLIHALGAETTGALRFWPAGLEPPSAAVTPPREVTRDELERRMRDRDAMPLALWDGKVRMSIAGMQDKLMVYLDRPLDDGGRMFLVEAPLASTRILKPDPDRESTPHLVANEHFCMSLATRMGLPAAQVAILRTPRPVLVVRRFDRSVSMTDAGPSVAPGRPKPLTAPAGGSERSERGGPFVHRLHVIDACQAADLPVSGKYERNFGSGELVRDIREGVSFQVLFERVDQTVNKAAARMTLLRWALFQFLIGNSDAHGKNFSFYVRWQGLEPAPWYDLISVVAYPGLDHEMAMAYGDAFSLDEVGAFQLADFAARCGIERRLLAREAARLSKLAAEHAAQQALAQDYVGDEREFVARLRDFVVAQGSRLTALAREAVRVRDEYL